MRTKIFLLLAILLSAFLFTGCNKNSDSASTMEAFMNAMVAKDSTQISQLSCPDFLSTAQEMIDSFSSVDLTIKDLSCSEKTNSGNKAIVNCSGTITTSYNNENTDIDLSKLDYQLQKINGDWLVCGQQ
jgi:PBP1b-binding outer membrane lipoprotein LpoB